MKFHFFLGRSARGTLAGARARPRAGTKKTSFFSKKRWRIPAGMVFSSEKHDSRSGRKPPLSGVLPQSEKSKKRGGNPGRARGKKVPGKKGA